MTYEVKKKAYRFGDKRQAHAVYGDRIDMASLYTNDEDLSSILYTPLTGVALDGSITLMGIGIDHLPILARIAIAKLWIYENQV